MSMTMMSRVTLERFNSGLTIEQFVESMSRNQDVFEENYRSFDLKDSDAAFFRSLGEHYKVLVLAEDWCGDVLRFVPAFARIAKVARTWDVRLFLRDESLDLSDNWLKDGTQRAIPVFVFFDEDMNEVAHFIEKPVAVYEEDARAREFFAEQHPELPDASLPFAQMSEKTTDVYLPYIREYRARNRARWQQMFVDELKALLSR